MPVTEANNRFYHQCWKETSQSSRKKCGCTDGKFNNMAFTSEAAIGLVYKTMSTKWPSGLAHLVVAALFKKYQPQDTITRVELRQVLKNEIKMKNGMDPSTLFEQISSVKNKYNTVTKKIDEDDLIALVLDNASPAEY